jgi:indole-3-glycerol phosphate synthase
LRAPGRVSDDGWLPRCSGIEEPALIETFEVAEAADLTAAVDFTDAPDLTEALDFTDAVVLLDVRDLVEVLVFIVENSRGGPCGA